MIQLKMRLVDRGKFMPENDVEENAYKDSAWKSDLDCLGFYIFLLRVLEHLDLQKGQSFLNIGSGTGYLSTMAGFFLEENGINHGVELYMVNHNNDNNKGAGDTDDDGNTTSNLNPLIWI
uniref:Uncharacterized protein n=1 Tax=Meloidogyne enterolobii TaxID=390850 RepID=A0A6V7VX77_MELEN|nr:unnamed protein product [Meloidogyne enterolobii]